MVTEEKIKELGGVLNYQYEHLEKLNQFLAKYPEMFGQDEVVTPPTTVVEPVEDTDLETFRESFLVLNFRESWLYARQIEC